MEASADEEEFVAVLEAELDVGFVAVDIAVEDELIGGGAGKGEIEFDVRGAALGEDEGILFRVDDGGVEDLSVVHLLRGGKETFEDDAAPAVVIRKERRPELAVG